MHIGKKKITISAFIVVVFVSVIVWAATSYPNAAISFSGIKMVANGSTTQGFVDISLKILIQLQYLIVLNMIKIT